MRSPTDRIFNLDDATRAARRVLPRSVFDFYFGGAEDERSLAFNRTAFDALQLHPRMLSGVRLPALQARILGRPAQLPLVVAPMGAVGFGRRGGDAQLAQAARAAGIPFVLSTVATTTIEAAAHASGEGRRWFQLYPLQDRALMQRLAERAADAGYEALVLTVDVPEGGKRERDLRNDFTMPFRFTARNVAGFAARPRWALDMLMHGVPGLENLTGPARSPHAGRSSGTASVGAGFDASFGWSDLAELRRHWRGPLLVKGLLRPDDARRAQEAGADGIVVSNHGGRQLDGAVPALAAVAAMRAEVGPAMDLIVDGGVRRGTDVVKALACGANAVMLGRPLLFGVCAAGTAGASRVIELLADELRRAMVLCGAARLEDVTADLVSRRND